MYRLSCVDCGRELGRKPVLYCRSCAVKARHSGLEPSVDVIKSVYDNRADMLYCISCGVELKSKPPRRCKPCSVRKRCEDPAARRKHSEISTELWRDTEYRRRQMEVRHNESYRVRHRAAHNTPEYLEGQSARSEALWEDSAYRDYMGCAIQEYWADDNNRRRQSVVMRRVCTRPSTKRRKSVAAKKMWSDPEFRCRMREVVNNPEYRRRLSNSTKMNWALGVMSPDMWLNPSGLELLVLAALDELALDYISQYSPSGYNRVYDVLLPDFDILIEVDGWYWHKSGDAVSRGVPARDAEKDQWAHCNGYTLIRLAECDIKEFGATELLKSGLVDYMPMLEV